MSGAYLLRKKNSSCHNLPFRINKKRSYFFNVTIHVKVLPIKSTKNAIIIFFFKEANLRKGRYLDLYKCSHMFCLYISLRLPKVQSKNCKSQIYAIENDFTTVIVFHTKRYVTNLIVFQFLKQNYVRLFKKLKSVAALMLKENFHVFHSKLIHQHNYNSKVLHQN